MRVHSPRKRGRRVVDPLVVADAPKALWANHVQYDSTIDGTAVKIASMIDEHTPVNLCYTLWNAPLPPTG